MSDRLSVLPECLIVRILSLLPLKEAVRTGTLSKLWKSHWKHIDNVFYLDEYRELSKEQQRDFASFLTNAVMQCRYAKTISVVTDCVRVPVDDVLTIFLRWVVQRNLVESLTMGFRRCKCAWWEGNPLSCLYTPPEWFYRYLKLVKLNMICWKIITPAPIIESRVMVSWTRLKSLTLDDTWIGDAEMFVKILSGCPVLENLDLCDVEYLNTLNVTSSSLLKLSVRYIIKNMEERLLEINAPRLQFLNLFGWFGRGDLNLVNASSLVNASLRFDRDDPGDHDLPIKLLENVHDRVQELTVDHEFMPSVSDMKLCEAKPCPLFKCCKRLTFILSVYKHELPGIKYLLQGCSHNLEMLVIEVRSYHEGELQLLIEDLCEFDPANYLMSMEIGDFTHLKNIKVTYCCCKKKTNTSGKYFDFELVTSILRKARVLEKLVVEPQEEFCKCSWNCSRERAAILSHKLLQSFIDQDQVSAKSIRFEYVLFKDIH